MTRYAAFLRGVNVGGVNLKMAEVAKAFERGRIHQRANNSGERQRPVGEPFRGGGGEEEGRSGAARRVRLRRLGACLRHRTVAAISEAFPFEREVEGHHSYVTFVTDKKVLDELAALGKEAGPDEKIKRGKGVIYWQVPRTGTLDTTIGKTMGKKRYKSSTTTRNLRTIDKVLR